MGARIAFESPTKEQSGLLLLLMAAVLFVFSVMSGPRGLWANHFRAVVKLTWPIWGMLGYAWLFVFVNPVSSPSISSFTQWMLLGMACFLVNYLLFSRLEEFPWKWAILILLGAGLVQLFVYAYDISIAYVQGRIISMEYLKDIPRVGKKFVSLAVAELFFLSLVLVDFKIRGYSAWSLVLAWLSLLTIASLDARAEYFALGVTFMLVLSWGKARRVVHDWLLRLTPNRWSSYFMVLVIVLTTIMVAGMAGSQRWAQFLTSVNAAVKTDHGGATKGDHNTSDLSESKNTQDEIKKWASPSYWNSHESNDRFRYTVDSSAYLRLSWIKFGVNNFIESPWGIGVNQFPLQELLNQKFPELKAQNLLYKDAEFHSAFLDMAVCLGLPGVCFALYFFYRLFKKSYVIWEKPDDNWSWVAFAVAVILGSALLRLVVDGLTEGLWYYVMSVAGILAGTTAAKEISSEFVSDANRELEYEKNH